MKAEEIAVVADSELWELVSRLQAAATSGRAVRLTVEGGVKIDNGNGGGWTLPFGRLADKTGR
jgi:hypothetical protein